MANEATRINEQARQVQEEKEREVRRIEEHKRHVEHTEQLYRALEKDSNTGCLLLPSFTSTLPDQQENSIHLRPQSCNRN